MKIISTMETMRIPKATGMGIKDRTPATSKIMARSMAKTKKPKSPCSPNSPRAKSLFLMALAKFMP